jgi:hypothetical protein
VAFTVMVMFSACPAVLLVEDGVTVTVGVVLGGEVTVTLVAPVAELLL